MPTVFWGGKLSWPMTLVVQANCALAWVVGNARNTFAMKERMRLGYEGALTDHVTRYDELGLDHYTRTSSLLLDAVDVEGKSVLDVGCGTGIVSFLAVQRNAARVIGVDVAENMIRWSQTKAVEAGVGADRLQFRMGDSEALPFGDASFEVVVSDLILGLIPDQARVVMEMARVALPGGYVALTTHGTTHLWEACDAAFRSVNPRHVLGYRIEYWPRKESEVRRLLESAGLVDIRTSSSTWQTEFVSGGRAYDFFAATSGAWWSAKFPADARMEEHRKVRDYFERKGVRRITSDVLLASGRKPQPQ